MNAKVIEVSGLNVRVGGTQVLREVSFIVPAGEIYAVLGHGGSGKTTLLEAVAGLRRPDSGTVRVRGADPIAGAARVGALWADGGLFPGLTVREVVDTWRRWTDDPLGRDEVLCLVGIAELADVPFERLGAGQRRRLDLALALVGRSDVLLLNEPTAGLDRGDREEIWAVLRSLSRGGVTVLLATGDAAEARRADRVGVLDGARLPVGRFTGHVPAPDRHTRAA